MRKKQLKILVLFFFFCIFNLALYGFCVGEEGKAKMSVSILPNPINTLAKKIKETRELISQKKQELKERKNLNVSIFLRTLGIGGVLILFIIFKDRYSRYKKREERRIKRKIAKKRKKKKR